jgi:hypothetical protein
MPKLKLQSLFNVISGVIWDGNFIPPSFVTTSWSKTMLKTKKKNSNSSNGSLNVRQSAYSRKSRSKIVFFGISSKNGKKHA